MAGKENWEIFDERGLEDFIKEDVLISPFGESHYISYMLSRFKIIDELELGFFDQKIYNVRYKDKEFTFICSGLGPSNAEITMSILLKKSNFKNAILVGSSGGRKKDIMPGELVIPEAFGSEEDVSAAASEPDYFGESGKGYYRTSKKTRQTMMEIAKEKGITYQNGTVVTTSSLLKQENLKYDKSNISVDMEGAAFAAGAKALGKNFGACMWISDSPENQKLLKDPRDAIMKRAIDNCLEIAYGTFSKLDNI